MKLAVPRLLLVAHLGLILKNNDFLAFALSLRGSNYFCSVNSGPAYRHLIALSDKQYFVQLDSIALGHVQAFHIYNLTGSYFILFATSFNNSVNF